MIRKIIYLTIFSSAVAWGCQTGAGDEQTESSVAPEQTMEGGQATVVDDVSEANIVAVAVGSPDHTTLVAAVQAAGLVDVLANNGPFTVFAPTNAAFDKLP